MQTTRTKHVNKKQSAFASRAARSWVFVCELPGRQCGLKEKLKCCRFVLDKVFS
jgi:hypothetical protein